MASKFNDIRIIGLIGIIILLAGGYVIYFQFSTISDQLSLLTEETQTLRDNVFSLQETQRGLLISQSGSQQQLNNASKKIQSIESQLGGFEATVGNISGTVTTLEKLSKTDPELLQKYSKVYFLNEHYSPERLEEIPTSYLYEKDEPELIHALVSPYLISLLAQAKQENNSLFVRSAYRSFSEQTYLKNGYTTTFGAGTANQFSADQGYSEHQLGTTIDLTTTKLKGALDGFDTTPEYEWMLQNAHKYGFTLSYPPNNQFYVFEPWHWRFVGVKLATDLHSQGKYFYDLEQRDIDEYLIHLFEELNF